MISIDLPSLEITPSSKLEAIYKLVQSTPELGFAYKANLRDHIRENAERGTLWAAYEDSALAGVAMAGSRRLYTHLMRHGEISVLSEYRRRRIGTALYAAQVLQALLEGRREVEDTIIPSLSPWMAGPTDCGPGFLPALQYAHVGTLPARTGGFRDVALFVKSTIQVKDYLVRLPSDVAIEVRDSEKVKNTFEKNVHTYSEHDPALAEKVRKLRTAIIPALDFVTVLGGE